MKPRVVFAALAVLVLSSMTARAIFMQQDLEKVPLDRLLTNLQQQLAKNTNDVETLYRLARVHSMAYATNLTEVSVDKKSRAPEFSQPWEVEIPKRVLPRSDPESKAEAHQHLTNAIGYYERAASLVRKGANASVHRWLVVPIHLGWAWCLDESGQREAAIKAYRKALQLAWKQEVDEEFSLKEQLEWSWDRLRAGQNPLTKPPTGHLGPGPCYSEEIIGYLLKLLDPEKDKKEIAQLKSDLQILKRMPRAVTPILVPLDDDVALSELVDPLAAVEFDLDGSGSLRRWGWITPKAAWLVFDRNNSGRITSALQMFGNVTFWIFWRDGYDALASLDDDGDGMLRGAELRGLALWHDRNSNGISEPGEARPVAGWNITALDCRGERHSSGIQYSPAGVVFQDGTARPTFDWVAPMKPR